MNERVKYIRLSQTPKINQEDFGKRIGVTGATISRIEAGNRSLTDRMIADICREFGVNETWLRTGDGQPFRQLSRTEELSAFFGDVLSDAPNFRSALITVLARMSPDEWQLLERKARELAQEMEKTGPD